MCAYRMALASFQRKITSQILGGQRDVTRLLELQNLEKFNSQTRLCHET